MGWDLSSVEGQTFWVLDELPFSLCSGLDCPYPQLPYGEVLTLRASYVTLFGTGSLQR